MAAAAELIDAGRKQRGAGMRGGQPARPRVLLVDDAPEVLRTTGVFLAAAGFDVVRAADGEAALAVLDAGVTFALLVTDYAMPGLNGIVLAHRALAQLPELKALIITGYPGTDDFLDLPSGIAVLVKPFRRAELIGILRAWFDIGQTIA